MKELLLLFSELRFLKLFLIWINFKILSRDYKPSNSTYECCIHDEERKVKEVLAGNNTTVSDTESQPDDPKFIYSLRGIKKLKNMFYVRVKYIKYGFRAHPNMTVGKCLRSLFMLHNETFNVWTHLISGSYYLY